MRATTCTVPSSVARSPAALTPAKVCSPSISRPVRRVLAGASDRDFGLGPLNTFDLMDRQLAQMNRELDAMSRQIDQEFNQWDRAFDRALSQQTERALSQAQEVVVDQPGLRIRASEQRGSGSYSYYQSISITSGTGLQYPPPSSMQAVGPSPLLALAVILTGLYGVLATAFARNIQYTLYKDESGLRLGLLWPVLFATSEQYRLQFWYAVQGKAAPVADVEGSSSKK